MKLSTKCRYGTRAMIEIARCFTSGEPVKRKDISTSQGISHAYLENILIALKSGKLIRTTRGANGGFTLELSPDKITLYQIVSVLEGSLAPVACLDDSSLCEKSGRCPARKAWQKLYDAERKILSSISLQDLLDDEHDEGSSSYMI